MYHGYAAPDYSGRPQSQNRHLPLQENARSSPGEPEATLSMSSNERDWRYSHAQRPNFDHPAETTSDYSHGPSRSRSPRRRITRGYRDRDREGYKSPIYKDNGRRSSSHSRSPSRSRNHYRGYSPRERDRSPYYGGPPSRDVILDGLPIEMGADDISRELINNYQVEGVENIRVIRDRWSGISRQFAYIRFSSINTAKVFLQKNYPAIYLVGAGIASNQDGADQTKVRIAFSREREDRDRDRQGRLDGVDDWNCAHCSALNFQRRTECFQCGTFKDDDGTTGPLPHIQPQYVNTGDNDVSHDGTPSQFLLLRNLEPSVTEDILAKGVCKLYKSSEDHSLPAHPIPNKRIESRAASGTANVNVGATEGSLRRVLLVRDRGNNESWRFAFAEFATVEDSHAALKKFAVMEKFTISSKPVLVTHPHTGVFIPALANDRFSFSPLHNLAARLVYWDQAAYVSELVIQVEEPKKPESGAAKSKKSTTEGKSKKRKADSAASANPKKTAPAHLEFWHNRQAELHEIEHIIQRVEAAPPASAKAKVITTNTPDKSFESFADRTRKCCLLCSRQFKTDEEVEKHERISQLHKDNLKNPKLKEKAILKLSKVKNAADDAVASAYRDRAKERRETFNQPKKPAPEITSLIDQPHAPTKEKSPPRQSKGAALLSKMGWTEGSGLGAQGTGILVPIASDMYVQGVGLGAEGGKIGDASLEAERNTKDSYSSFVERAKDKAKERFDRMQ